jgi:hypothetical protein
VSNCRECGAVLEGRSDKEFCDSTCRKRFGRREFAEEKTYLLADAPQQSGLTSERKPLPKSGRTIVVLPIAEVRDAVPGSYETTLTAQEIGTAVEFVNGRYSTSDPEIQRHLDARGGWCSEEQWEAAWLSDEEQRDRRAATVEALAREVEQLRLQAAGGA